MFLKKIGESKYNLSIGEELVPGGQAASATKAQQLGTPRRPHPGVARHGVDERTGTGGVRPMAVEA